MRFFKLLQISKTFSDIFIEKHLHISGPTQFKPVLFKGRLHFSGASVKLKQLKGRSFSFVTWQFVHNYDWLSRALAKGHLSIPGGGGLCSRGESWTEHCWRQISPVHKHSSSSFWPPSGCFVCCERQTALSRWGSVLDIAHGCNYRFQPSAWIQDGPGQQVEWLTVGWALSVLRERSGREWRPSFPWW